MHIEKIQELVGLAVEKGVGVRYDPSYNTLFVDLWGKTISTGDFRSPDAPAQLQAAIDKVKAL